MARGSWLMRVGMCLKSWLGKCSKSWVGMCSKSSAGRLHCKRTDGFPTQLLEHIPTPTLGTHSYPSLGTHSHPTSWMCWSTCSFRGLVEILKVWNLSFANLFATVLLCWIYLNHGWEAPGQTVGVSGSIEDDVEQDIAMRFDILLSCCLTRNLKTFV